MKSHDYPSASELTQNNMGKLNIWIMVLKISYLPISDIFQLTYPKHIFVDCKVIVHESYKLPCIRCWCRELEHQFLKDVIIKETTLIS